MLNKINLRKKQLVYLPAFFYQAMVRNSITFDQFMDYNYIKNKFSKHDLSIVFNLNRNYGGFFNFIKDDVSEGLWVNSDILEIIKYNNYTPDHYLQIIKENLLFANNDKKYNINDTHGKFIFVILYPSIIDGCMLEINTQITQGLDKSDNFKLIKGILKLLYGYEKYENVVNNNLYGTYIKYLM